MANEQTFSQRDADLQANMRAHLEAQRGKEVGIQEGFAIMAETIGLESKRLDIHKAEIDNHQEIITAQSVLIDILIASVQDLQARLGIKPAGKPPEN